MLKELINAYFDNPDNIPDRFPNWTDGGSESTTQNSSIVSTDVLADGTQSSHLD